METHAWGGDKGILCLWEGPSRGEGVNGEMREQSTLIITTIWILPVRADKHVKENTKTSRICAMEKWGNPVFRKKPGRILSHWFEGRLRNHSLCCLLRLQMWWTLSPGPVLPLLGGALVFEKLPCQLLGLQTHAVRWLRPALRLN